MERMRISYATSRNGMHMLYPIQTHIHTDTYSMKTPTLHNTFTIMIYAMHSFICSFQSLTFFLVYLFGNLFRTAYIVMTLFFFLQHTKLIITVAWLFLTKPTYGTYLILCTWHIRVIHLCSGTHIISENHINKTSTINYIKEPLHHLFV